MNSQVRHHKALISVGSNVADSRRRVADALTWLDANFASAHNSEIYTTPDATKPDRPDYANAVVSIVTCLDAETLNSLLKGYEHSQGRTKGETVVIDLDLVVYDSAVLRIRDYTRQYFTIGLNMLENQ